MIIKEINVFNLGVYKGQHSIQIEPYTNKPVILFGALNGSGKTTLLEGIQIALYGKSAKTQGRAKKSYEEYLSSLINRDIHKKHGASVEVIFTVNINSIPSEIKITRSWKETEKGIQEFCNIVQDGIDDPNASDRASEFVEEIIPSEISNLFFFDGEMIDGYSQPEQSKFLIQKGIHTLLGINNINNLVKSLKTIEQRKSKNLSKEHDELSTENEEREAFEIEKKKDGLRQDLSSVNNELDLIEKKLNENKDQLKQQGHEIFKKRDVLKNNLKNLESQSSLIHNQMKEVAYEQFPLSIMEEEILELADSVNKMDGFSPKSLTLIEEEFNKLIKSNIFSDVDKKSIEEYKKERLEDISKSFGSYAYDLDASILPTKDDFKVIKNKIKNLLNEYEDTHLEIDKVEKTINAVPDEDKIKPLIEEELELTKNKQTFEAKKTLLIEEIEKLGRQLDVLYADIQTKNDKKYALELDNIIDKKMIEKSVKTRTTLENFKAALIDKHIHSISDEISQCFNLLSRKKKLNLVFKINPNDFSLEVYKDNKGILEEYVTPTTWAAGEKQILGISILWALTKVAKMTFPIVIDTPLSRLDNSHRESVIKNYFPNASHQVLVFSTDTEINDELLKKLKPKVSYEYLIEYNNETNSSNFNKGYFNNDKRMSA